jgi:hypothetical protein
MDGCDRIGLQLGVQKLWCYWKFMGKVENTWSRFDTMTIDACVFYKREYDSNQKYNLQKIF